MPRIPDDDLARLKQEVSLQRLVEAKGVKLSRHGGDLIGLCPFHNDTTPSLVVSPDKNLWHCLGACQAGGSVIDWVMKAEGVSFRHAVELLRADAPSLAASAGRVVKKSSVVKLAPVLAHDADDQAALVHVVDYYNATLKESPEALAYLDKRGLRSAEAVDHFKLGYSNRTLCYRLPQTNRVAGAELRGRLQALGILRESGHEHFRGSLVIPILGDDGHVLGMYGRKINDHLREGTPSHLYLPGPHRGVWNIAAVKLSEEIILCEALIDALTFWCAGFRNVTTSYGVEGFTPAHLEAFKKHGTKRVLIAYDHDDAGDNAAAALATKLMAEGLDCYRTHFPKGMDANEYALAVQPAEKSLRLAITNAEWLGKGQRRAPTSAPAVAATAPEVAAPTTPVEAPETTPAPLAAKEEPPAAERPAALPAMREAPPPRAEVPAEINGDEVVICFGDRRWRLRGLLKNMSYELLRVNILCGRGEAFHVDTLDLYSARQRVTFLKQAKAELGVEEDVLKRDLGKVLMKLEQLQDEQIKAALKPKEQTPAMSEDDRNAALDLLRSPDLLDRILGDFERCGLVGEETNKLVGYIASVSRKLDKPLAIIIQSSSAAGKSSVMEAILAFVPQEERTKYSAMTGQSLFYMGETDLKHKVLAIVEEAGAERAAYALKLLQSEGEITIASTGKDPTTGRLITHEYRVEGPVMIFLTTTAVEIDDELLNRCIVLTVDEEREQTRAIHRMQRESHTLDGLLARKTRGHVLKVHQNAQRLLRPLWVLNPYAEQLTFTDDRTRTRRDHEKYLTLIDAIALLHQFQRPVLTAKRGGEVVEYVEVTQEDVALANRLAHQVLGRSLDELPPQTRRLLLLLDKMAAEECSRRSIERTEYRFSRREVREHTGWGNTQLKIHMQRLEELEYLVVHRGGRGQSFVYELVYDGSGKDGSPFLCGLIEPEKLGGAHAYDGNRSGFLPGWSGQKGEWSGVGRPLVGPKSGGGRGEENRTDPHENKARRDLRPDLAETALLGADKSSESYVTVPAVAVAAGARH